MINNIQTMRCFSALLVVMYHIPGIMDLYGIGNYALFGKWSAFGVDIFFVISGYIMSRISSRGNLEPGHFILKRILRVFPLYSLLTLSMMALILFFPSIFHKSKLDLLKDISSLFFISHFFGYDYPLLFVGWSLEYEALFYFLFFISMYIKNENYRFLALFIMLSVVMIMGWSYTISIEFIYGICIYRLEKLFKSNLNIKRNYYFLSLVVLVFCVSQFKFGISPSTVSRPFTYGIIAFFIVLASVFAIDSPKGILTKIGDASYSIYLTQVFSIPISLKIMSVSGFNNYPMIVFYLSFLFVVAFGILTYYLVEARLSSFFSRRWMRSNKQPT